MKVLNLYAGIGGNRKLWGAVDVTAIELNPDIAAIYQDFFLNAQGVIRYPDMSLWQEIIFLKHFCKTKYVVENVESYYEPFVKPFNIDRHYFWANFNISDWHDPQKKKLKISLLNTRASTRRSAAQVIDTLQK